MEEKLNFLKKEMSKFFDCDESYIKFSDPISSDNRHKIDVEYTFVDRERSTSTKLHTITYYFNFEIDNYNFAGVWYESNFYSFQQLDGFLNELLKEIKALK
jgi:hypothetical protein